jgi:hypothetical protein
MFIVLENLDAEVHINRTQETIRISKYPKTVYIIMN